MTMRLIAFRREYRYRWWHSWFGRERCGDRYLGGLRCVLIGGHPDGHGAQLGHELVMWDDTADLGSAKPCEAYDWLLQGDDRTKTPCQIPLGHGGPHRMDYTLADRTSAK